jgi:hypothetical protein
MTITGAIADDTLSMLAREGPTMEPAPRGSFSTQTRA